MPLHLSFLPKGLERSRPRQTRRTTQARTARAMCGRKAFDVAHKVHEDADRDPGGGAQTQGPLLLVQPFS